MTTRELFIAAVNQRMGREGNRFEDWGVLVQALDILIQTEREAGAHNNPPDPSAAIKLPKNCQCMGCVSRRKFAERYRCAACGGTPAGDYMVNDITWASAGFEKKQFACILCLNLQLFARTSRFLRRDDFPTLPCNAPIIVAFNLGLLQAVTTYTPCRFAGCTNEARYDSGYCGLCDLSENGGRGELRK